jgi:hypothetical protein
MVFQQTARRIWQILETAGEFLTIEIEGFGEALLLHVLKSGKAVDLDRSETQKLSNGNVVVIRPVLRTSALRNAGIVRLEDLQAQLVLTEAEQGDSFQGDYARHRLTGLNFEVIEDC